MVIDNYKKEYTTSNVLWLNNELKSLKITQSFVDTFEGI